MYRRELLIGVPVLTVSGSGCLGDSFSDTPEAETLVNYIDHRFLHSGIGNVDMSLTVENVSDEYEIDVGYEIEIYKNDVRLSSRSRNIIFGSLPPGIRETREVNTGLDPNRVSEVTHHVLTLRIGEANDTHVGDVASEREYDGLSLDVEDGE